MLYSYGKFISGSVGAYTLEAALMGCSMDKGRVEKLRGLKSSKNTANIHIHSEILLASLRISGIVQQMQCALQQSPLPFS